ncbi:hypothetical protein FLM55_00475 [Francisella sp. Scap27]|uniref:hypothetical protein n=1 Tax=Francisella sp. Scap27 TaxID=2589986 RepID=UPI0015C14752|nr:hypothetical protein [Francisella sp. Scap27]QLE78289.1 hypothetical protein FLM55_00475 [Francisella sp. Scap27]
MNINKFIILSSTIALASCSTVKNDKTKVEFAAHNYPNMFIPVRVDVAKSSVKTAIGQNNSIANITQLKNLNELEKGRLLQLNGDFKGSIVSYANAIKTVPQSEEESIKKAKSIVLDRKSYNYYDIKTAYNIPDYAISNLYTYQALNYLKTNQVKNALSELDKLPSAELWTTQQDLIAAGIKQLSKKSLEKNDITDNILGLNNFEDLKRMFGYSKRIPNAYGNPLGLYLKAILESSISKDYESSLNDLNNAEQYAVGNKYLGHTIYEFNSAINSGNSSFSMGMGRVVVFYEQGLVNPRQEAIAKLDLGNIGDTKFDLPVYPTNYSFYEPKKVTITTDSKKTIVDTYTETLMDNTLFAIKSLIDEYPRIIAKNIMIEAYKNDQVEKLALGGLAGNHLNFSLSNKDPKRADLRSWLLLPANVDLFEQQLDSGKYTIQVNNIRQKVDIKQGKTTLLWVVEVGKFKKVFYFIV